MKIIYQFYTNKIYVESVSERETYLPFIVKK